MIKIKTFLLILTTVFVEASSANSLLLNQPENKEPSLKEINSFPELHFANESIIQNEDLENGLIEESYFTRLDEQRISVSLGVSADYEDFTKTQSLEFTYLNKIENYKNTWWGFQVKRTTGKYDAFADERTTTSTDTTNSDALVTRGIETQSMTIIGGGVSYRFKSFSQNIGTDRLFEVISVFGNYIAHLDGKTEDKYQGYGLSTDYSIHYRSGKSFFYGGKLSYNWATVTREAKGDEKQEDRSLAFGWLGLAFELGYYY